MVNWKRFTSLLLVFAMMFGMVPISANANEVGFISEFFVSKTEERSIPITTDAITSQVETNPTKEYLDPVIIKTLVTEPESTFMENSIPSSMEHSTIPAVETISDLDSPESTTETIIPEDNEGKYWIGPPPENFLSASTTKDKEISSIEPIIVDMEAEIPSNEVFSPTENSEDVSSSGPKRYTVLILDVEADMGMYYNSTPIYTISTPIETVKKAASKFVEQVQSANGTNYVAIVSYSSVTKIETGFTTDTTTLNNVIDNLSVGDMYANINDSFLIAEDLLDEINDENTIKNVVLFSQGLASEGGYSTFGKYSFFDCSWYSLESGVYFYQYANSVQDTVDRLMGKFNIYSIGLFQSFDDVPSEGQSLVRFVKRFTENIQNSGYYEVENVEDLEFAFGDAAEDIITSNLKTTGSFRYASGGQDYSSTFFYDDAYFFKSAFDYQDSLATMSMCLAFSAFASNRAVKEGNYALQSQNLKALLIDCGFPEENFDTNASYKQKPEKDTIGVGASHKLITVGKETYTLIAVAVRGGGYESEWSSNVTLGPSGTHQGFTEARDQVISFLKNYIANKGISGKVKLWITGFSRAAATTNLVAGKLDAGYSLSGNIDLIPANIYAYCFECPMGALEKDKVNNLDVYGNIFNIINPHDIVTKVAPIDPEEFGFSRYGDDQYLPTALKKGELGGDKSYSELVGAMLEKYQSLPSTKEYVIDDFSVVDIDTANSTYTDLMDEMIFDIKVSEIPEVWDMNAFLNEFSFHLFNDVVKTRGNYVSLYQEHLREACKVIFGSVGKWDNFADYFIVELGDRFIPFAGAFLAKNRGAIIYLIEEAAISAMNSAGIATYTKQEIHQLAVRVCSLLLQIGGYQPNLTANLLLRGEDIFSAHYPELCLAWLQSFDPNYTEGASGTFTSGIHRIIRINCPVNVFVYDERGELVAAIQDDKAQKISGSTIVSYVNEQDEKLIYLPADESYTVKLTAANNGSMDYSIQEYSESAGGVTRIINYLDVELINGETYSSIIPAFSDADLSNRSDSGSTTSYSLHDPAGNELSSDEDLSGEEAAVATYYVETYSNNDSMGIIVGSGVFRAGQYAKVTAIPNEGCSFYAWFSQDGILLSTEKEYRFRVDKDTTLTGVFSMNEKIEPTVKRLAGGSRYSTCTAVADELKATLGGGQFDSVVVASGADFPDALAGTYLAAVKKAPILLIDDGHIDMMKKYIDENIADSGTIYVLGSENSISKTAADALSSVGNVKRLGGKSRFITNLRILEELDAKTGELLVVYAVAPWDALSVSSSGCPILLVNETLRDDQKEYLETTNFDKITIIGSTAGVPGTMEAELSAYCSDVDRVYGSSRYKTTIEVAKYFYGIENGSVVLACGNNFPDGLCSGALGYAKKAPVILTDVERESLAAGYVTRYNSQTGYVIGSAKVVSDDSVRKAFNMTETDIIK